jgi:hypothetical protein
MAPETAAAAKLAPPASVTGLSLAGVSLPDVILVVTLIYTLLQLYVLVRDKFWRKRKDADGDHR